MHSIRTKLTVTMIAAILVSVLSVGIIAVAAFSRASRRNADERIRLICENRGEILDEYFSSIRQSVDTVSREALSILDTIALVENDAVGCSGEEAQFGVKEREAPLQEALDQYLTGHVQAVREIFEAVVNYTYGVGTYFYVLNPELSSQVEGFLYSRLGKADFVSVEVPQVRAFTPENPGAAEFFYQVLAKGRPSWLEPHDDVTLGEKLTSYIVPLYKAGALIGMIGMDISYETLVSQVEDITVYESGYAALFGEDMRVVYHPVLPFGTELGEINEGLGRAIDEQEQTGGAEDGGIVLRYTANGIPMQVAYTGLSNGLRLAVAVPVSEIDADWTSIRNIILLISTLIVLLFAVFFSLWLRRITDPLKRLSVAARLLSAGKFDVELPYEGNDEIGVLTESFRNMRGQLKEYIGDLRGQAFTDSLTHVRNKRSFDQMMKQLDGQIISGEAERAGLALVMFDCNFLKTVNDEYGHEKGDVYLQNACRVICKTFQHSPVFRLGGDEFAAVLQGDDYHDRDLLIGEFRGRCAEHNAAAKEPWQRVDLSLGIATYDPKKDFSAEELLSRADARMYDAKKAYKESLT